MKNNTEESIQSILFQRIQESLPINCSLAEELSDILGVSTDSVYRRLRNETMLSVEETALLCKKYSISFDSLIKNNEQSVLCNYALLRSKEDLIKHYLFMNQQIQMFNSLPDASITYAAIDIPIFHHFQFRELSAFKTFYYVRSVISDKEITGQQFDTQFLSDEHLNILANMYAIYLNVPVREIWTDSTIKSLIKQIEYCWESGIFKSKEDALLICSQAKQEIEEIQRLAQDADNNKFKLYFSEIEIGNNSILAQSGEHKRTYLSYNTINVLVSSHNGFCEETQMWQNNLIQKATLISGASEKIRYQFFRRLLDDIDRVIEKIEK